MLLEELTNFCSVEGNSKSGVPLAVIGLQLQGSAETVDSFVVVRSGKLEVGPGLFSINLWVEICRGTSGKL